MSQVAYRQTNYNPNPTVPAYPSAVQYQALSPLYTSQPTYQAPAARQYHQNYGSPVKGHPNYSKNIPYHDQQQLVVSYSPGHKLYGPANYTNGELIQQQMYNHQMQYQQNREYQQYKQSREQILLHQQQGYGGRGYQNAAHIPVVVQSEHRNQYEPT